MNAKAVSRGLGWFSIALGLGELLATGPLARFLAMPDKKGLLRFYGVREPAAGIAILTTPPRHRAKWLWTRVAGDAIDLATLGWAIARAPRSRGRLAAATASVVGVTALDVACGAAL